MDPTVVAAWIAAGVSVPTLAGTVITQIIGFRSTKADNKETIEGNRSNTADFIEQQRKQLIEQLTETLKAQSEQLDRTLAEQRDQLDRALAEQNQQLDRTLAEQRTRTLNERFATAAEQLGSDKPAVRLAGVYAMAGLADDWEENRQTCVDVICAYLRMPYEPDPGPEAPEQQQLAFQASREVRHTVIRVITAHLQEKATVSWQGLSLDFRGVVFDGGDFNGAQFTGRVSFTGARFSGGTVYFRLAQFSGDWVDFHLAQFSGRVDFTGARFSRYRVSFREAQFSGGEVNFTGAQFSGAEVDFSGAKFSSGRVSFYGAQFSGGTVNFTGARFSGAEVDFSRAFDWSKPPAFPWTDTPPPGVKLPKKEDQSKA